MPKHETTTKETFDTESAPTKEKGKGLFSGQSNWKRKMLLWAAIGVMLVLFVVKVKNKITSKYGSVGSARGLRLLGNEGGETPSDETIFVAIPSGYDDVESTVLCIDRLFQTATHPSRIFVGVCQTGDGKHRKEGGWKSLVIGDRYRRLTKKRDRSFEENIRVIHEPRDEAKGFSNAMNMIQRFLFRGERYFATLDRRLKLIEGWDTTAIQEMKRCLQKSPRPILIDDACDGITAGRSNHKPSIFLVSDEWSEYGTPLVTPRLYRNPPVRPFRSLFYRSNFSFSLGYVARQVVYDPWYQHLPRSRCDWVHGTRLWTSGWDFFNPAKTVISGRVSVPWAETGFEHPPAPPVIDPLEEEAAHRRLWTFFGMITGGDRGQSDIRLDKYTPGTVRPLKDYASFTGMDWSRRVIHGHARVGMSLTRGSQRPFDDEEVAAKYGSWTEFYESTHYTPETTNHHRETMRRS